MERAAAPSKVGAGLQISSNATKVLAQLDPLARTVWGWLYEHDPTSPADTERGLETATRLAEACGGVAVIPDYRLAPEHPAALGAFGAFVAELVSPVDDRPTRS